MKPRATGKLTDRKVLEEHRQVDSAPATFRREQLSALTAREKEILPMLASGLSNQQIASELGISPHTVKSHIYNIYKKINVTSRQQVPSWVFEDD